MNKVYLITVGEYSDYHVERVFLSKEKAQAYAKARGNVVEIEEMVASDDDIEIIMTDGKFLRGNIESDGTVLAWLDYECRNEGQYVPLGIYENYCNISHNGDLSMGRRYTKTEWRGDETIAKFKKALTDIYAEVKNMIAEGIDTSMINEALSEKYTAKEI